MVEITGSDSSYRYMVDGVHQVIQGVVYNPNYGGLSEEERDRAYANDLSRMQRGGVNTIIGTGEGQEFDALLLDKAAEYDLGVVMPYYLDIHGDYTDAAYQAQIRTEVMDWVNRYKNHPALRMWALGNEMIANMQGKQIKAFARFFVGLADMVNQIDPNHPVLYRGAEEYDLEPLAQALAKAGGGPRPWLIYGMNVFTLRLEQTLADWPSKGWDGPVLVSAFGPLGLYPADRPYGYLRLWKAIRDYETLVLGGFAYVWTTAGANLMDQAFGLFEDDGSPADASFEALSNAFHGGIVQKYARRNILPYGGAPPRPDLSFSFSFEAIQPPSRVHVVGGNYQFTYLVNGRPEIIRGIGYNAMYQGLPLEERAARYDADFAAIRSLGANTIIGWGEQREFDELVLIKAHQHGLGVIMPYFMDPLGDYADAEYREAVRQDVVAWVNRFRGFPALRVWGLGNEVIHLLGNEDAKLFASFYVELADLVHRSDPDHPVAYRGAEDANIEHLILAFQADGQPRPWMLFGMNIFTFRIEQAIKSWPDWNWDVGLFFSEFGPLGLPPEERPEAFSRMWEAIEGAPGVVLGGLLYVWTTAGPEKVDLAFGLVDETGTPVDDLYEAVRAAYRKTASATPEH